MSGTWDFIGIRREPFRRRHPQQDQLIRWRLPLVGRGAFSRVRGNGHWRILGLWYHWEDREYFGYSKTRTLHLWKLAAISHEERNGFKAIKSGFTLTVAKLRWPIEGVR